MDRKHLKNLKRKKILRARKNQKLNAFNMEKELRKPDSDLQSAFEYNPQNGLVLADIHEMLAAVFGENDGADWHWLALLCNGKYAYISGGCDYTGWDCQSSASHKIFDHLEEALKAAPEMDSYNRPIRDALQKQLKGEEQYGVIVFNYGNIKFDEYKRLHKILTGVSPKSIWEVLKDTGDLSAILENVPDEFYKWVTETAENIENSYYAIEDVALEEFKKIIEIVYPQDPHRKNRKLWAEEIKKMTHPQIGFAMLDGKEYCDLIYKLVKPKGGEVFKQDEL